MKVTLFPYIWKQFKFTVHELLKINDSFGSKLTFLSLWEQTKTMVSRYGKQCKTKYSLTSDLLSR